MPIDPNFPKNQKILGKIIHTDGQHFHYRWGPGRLADASENEEVKAAYAARGEQIVPVGISGTMTAIDWDVCISDGSCIESCPVQVYQWYRTENDIPAIEMINTQSSGTGSTVKEDRKDRTDKPDPIREHDCIWCMACVAVCPVEAVKVEQSNEKYHQNVE